MNWDQLKSILWLRWRLTRNQWVRGGGLGAVLAMVIAVGAAGAGVLACIGGFLGGYLGLGEAKPLVVMGVWFGVTVGFLLFWLIGLMTELQRSETIDLQRLMHLPVALGQIFVLNYIASHLVVSIVIALPAMLGLTLGLALSRGPAMLLLLPLALAMVFMITAWTCCLRGWLAGMMANQRRRRAIITGITLLFIVVFQAPNLYFNLVQRPQYKRQKSAESEESKRLLAEQPAGEDEPLNQLLAARDFVLAAQDFVPPLWLPVGAYALAEHRPIPALLGTLGCFAIGALGLRRAYRGTIRFYRGDSNGRAAAGVQPTPAPASATAKTPASAHARFLERRLPGVPEPAAALALATFRSLLRTPEVMMIWAASFIVTILLGTTVFARATSNLSENLMPLCLTGAMAFSLFMLFQFLANQFGYDRDGFRALLLSPTDRRLILLGKNLACLPVGATLGLLIIAAISERLQPPPLTIVAAIFQLLTLLVLAGLGGNLLSILTPYRMAVGSMKPTKMPAAAVIGMIFWQMLLPLAFAPAFLPPLAEILWHWAELPPAVPVNLLLSVALAALVLFIYRRTLEPMGRLLQRREIEILNIVTAEVE